MISEEFHVWPQDETVTLTVFREDDSDNNRPGIIVIPGGAYRAPARREADPVAIRFAEMGYVGCVLRASTMYKSFEETDGEPNPHTVFPEPMQEVGAAIAFLRKNAEKFGLDGDRIALCGFSAGAHLAANYCNYYDTDEVCTALGVDAEEIKPSADVLCYAATHLNHNVPGDMLTAIFGKKDEYERREVDKYNARYHVGSQTPPTFMWHTADDSVVPVAYTYEMAKFLADAKVPHAVHVFSTGHHAAGLSQGMAAENWPKLADDFLRRYM